MRRSRPQQGKGRSTGGRGAISRLGWGVLGGVVLLGTAASGAASLESAPGGVLAVVAAPDGIAPFEAGPVGGAPGAAVALGSMASSAEHRASSFPSAERRVSSFQSADTVRRPYQPGAPGEAGRFVTPGEPGTLPLAPYTEDDVHFMQMMIGHHAQALAMAALAPERAEREDIRRLAHRVAASQEDEIALMQRWLAVRGEEVPDDWHHHPDGEREGHARWEGHAHCEGHARWEGHAHRERHDRLGGHDHAGADGHGLDDARDGYGGMPGMLSPAHMDALAAARGAEFDRLFLEFMIFHHEGAVLMVNDLFRSPGGGQDGEVFHFASHVKSDQTIEIERMRGMLADES